jgi:SAM-dependent methyltransferase
MTTRFGRVSPVRDLTNTPDRLAARLGCNRAGSSDFDRFVLDLLDPAPTDVVLDIGPGTGKQMLLLVSRVRRILGLDVSPDMVAALGPRLPEAGARLLVGSMDDLPSLGLPAALSHGYAVYSLYYSADPRRVVETVLDLLQGPGARFVVVTPDEGSNADWYADLGRLFEVPADALEVPGICRRVILPAFRDHFGSVTCSTHCSDVRFACLADLMRYYDGCAPYCRPDRRADAEAYFRTVFERDGAYVISKRSLGLVGRP